MTKVKIGYKRNPVYVIYAVVALLMYLLCKVIAERTDVGFFERTIFDLFYRLPEFFNFLFLPFLLASFLSVTVFALFYTTLKRRYDILIRLVVSISLAFLLAALLGPVRDAPENVLDNVNQRILGTSNGFPSVIMAVFVAGGLVISLYAPKSYRHLIDLFLYFVAFSLLYFGINLPLDLIAGFLVGLFSFSFCSLAFGAAYYPVNPKLLMKKLRQAGLSGIKLKPLSADARGSTPFFGSYDGGPIFVKVYNRDNNAADWLFKVTRRLRYRRLEDEVPSFTAKRAIEHEAYTTMLAKHTANARTPKLLGIFKIEQNSYALATELIDAKGMDSLSKDDISDKLLADTWEEIKKLHKARFIHKDLRTANIMVEKSTGLPWLIDFGFSESAVEENAFFKDTVEFIASSAVIVGAKRAVQAALKSSGKQSIKNALPYMQYSAISGATTTKLKAQKGLLDEIRREMKLATNATKKESKKVRMKRI